MEEQGKGGLEAIVSEKPMQKKKPGSFWKKLPYRFSAGICAIGVAALYLAGISGYKGVKEFIMVQKYPSAIQDRMSLRHIRSASLWDNNRDDGNGRYCFWNGVCGIH